MKKKVYFEYQSVPDYEEEERRLLDTPARRWKPPLSPRSSLTMVVAATLTLLLILIAGAVLRDSKGGSRNGKHMNRKNQRESIMTSITSVGSGSNLDADESFLLDEKKEFGEKSNADADEAARIAGEPDRSRKVKEALPRGPGVRRLRHAPPPKWFARRA